MSVFRGYLNLHHIVKGRLVVIILLTTKLLLLLGEPTVLNSWNEHANLN